MHEAHAAHACMHMHAAPRLSARHPQTCAHLHTQALNERGVFIRVQLLPQATPLFNMVQPDMRNELVLRLQPGAFDWV